MLALPTRSTAGKWPDTTSTHDGGQTMSADKPRTEPSRGRERMERRGLMAAVWAAVLGFVLKQTTQPVQAASA